ncbi:hypothetical protein M9194_04310 [Vibrio sp. S4M6]|uniref:hypothetical protein n=1 Tax=Vibrio sinus TaxID=2946865 RepID=UPI00202A958B|nr:hypothetical protein [Vibrio sinus]MCL9780659.1 hypothetical protein [Vibrio sinus]
MNRKKYLFLTILFYFIQPSFAFSGNLYYGARKTAPFTTRIYWRNTLCGAQHGKTFQLQDGLQNMTIPKGGIFMIKSYSEGINGLAPLKYCRYIQNIKDDTKYHNPKIPLKEGVEFGNRDVYGIMANSTDGSKPSIQNNTLGSNWITPGNTMGINGAFKLLDSYPAGPLKKHRRCVGPPKPLICFVEGHLKVSLKIYSKKQLGYRAYDENGIQMTSAEYVYGSGKDTEHLDPNTNNPFYRLYLPHDKNDMPILRYPQNKVTLTYWDPGYFYQSFFNINVEVSVWRNGTLVKKYDNSVLIKGTKPQPRNIELDANTFPHKFDTGNRGQHFVATETVSDKTGGGALSDSSQMTLYRLAHF